MLDTASFTPPSSSPRTLESTRERAQNNVPASRRFSRNFDTSNMGSNPPTAVPFNMSKPPSRPNSPFGLDSENRSLRTPRYGILSPAEQARKEQSQSYFVSNPPSAHTATGKRPPTPLEPPDTGHLISHRKSPSIDGSFMGSLPHQKEIVRVIYAGGETRVVRVLNCKTSEEIIRSTLRKFGLREDHVKNYCFYVLDGTQPDAANCRRISDAELVRICSDRHRAERSRLILRKIHAGEPGEEELQRAAQIAAEESNSSQAIAIKDKKNRTQKILERLTGEPWENIQYPLSPQSPRSRYSTEDRDRSIDLGDQDYDGQDYEGQEDAELLQGQPADRRTLRRFFGQRPPSELISSDLATYFPEHQKEDIEKTVRMSMRRSARLSRATSRLSTASNFSFASSLRDAPPIPSIAETWLTGANQSVKPPRPLSIARIGLPQTSYRDSVASTALEPLREESPSEPNRKSYVSFESGSDTPSGPAQDNHTNASLIQSYYDDESGMTLPADAGGSLNQSLQQVLEEDGEEKDEELTQFLATDSWDNIKWMKGALIGQGSFGSVFLALNGMTGGLMAVKQVEMPSDSGSQRDNKKRGMVEALKREIGLLRELQHPNIVQYLGSSSDDEYLNIFLEYVPGGSVAAMLNQYGPQREPLIRNFVRQILTGLAYLHGRDIIHRDIKGANVLVDHQGRIKISDFGISKRVEASSLLNSGAGHSHRPSLQGSVFWMAPEVVKQTSYTRKADIWSLGCLVVEMFTGNHPYPDCTQLQAIFKIGNSKASPTLPDVASEEAKTFLQQTFEIDHTQRPSADELLLSPFLNAMA